MVSLARLPDDLRSLIREGERIELLEDGAAIVPLEDLRLLEELEDRDDVETIRHRLEDPSEKPVPYDEARVRLGLG